MKAYEASEENGFFPYEWFDSAEKLNENQLPPIESFWSKLKNHNVLSVDYDKFMVYKKRGIEEKEALKKLKLKNSSQKCRGKLSGTSKHLGKGEHEHISRFSQVVYQQRRRAHS